MGRNSNQDITTIFNKRNIQRISIVNIDSSQSTKYKDSSVFTNILEHFWVTKFHQNNHNNTTQQFLHAWSGKKN